VYTYLLVHVHKGNGTIFSSYLLGFVATLMLGIRLIKGLCGFAGKSSEPEGNREAGLAVALSRYLGFVGDLKEE
jgi:hypothetical protein